MADCWCWSAASTRRACCAPSSPSTRRGRPSFFGSTAAVEGWRVCIVDTVDELNPNAANALLEDFRRAAAAVAVSAAQPCAGAGAADHPVALPQAAAAAARAADVSAPRRWRRTGTPTDPALRRGRRGGRGQRRARAALLGGDALKLQQRTAALLDAAARRSARTACAGRRAWRQRPGGARRPSSTASIAGSAKAARGDANANLPRLARLAEVWEKIVRAARDTESYNLERKPLVFSVFGMLAEATR